MTFMATMMQRQEARRRARELKIQEEAKLQEALKRKSDAREEVFVCLDQVNDVHAAAGRALQVLLDGGDSKDEIIEVFGLTKSELSGYLRAYRESDRSDDPSSSDVEDQGSATPTEDDAASVSESDGSNGSTSDQAAPSYA